MNKKNLNILKYSCLIIFIFICSVFASASQIQENEIIQTISQQKNKHDLKSVVFGVWEDNHPITLGALGESMTGVPATKDMHFRIGGVSETFLTTLLLQLVDEEKVKLEDKISKWLPNLPNADRVTLKMLANSTSGYPDYEKSPEFVKAFEKDVFNMWTTKELLDYAFASPPLFEPGTQWNYSHTNYVVLGDVLEKITHEPIAQLLHEKIFHKLDLRHTAFSIVAEMPYHVLHAFSSDRGVYEDSTFWSPSWTSFSGSMTSTIEDLGKWAHAFGTGALLSTKSHQAMMEPVRIEKDNPKLGFGMGFAMTNSWLVQNPTFGGYSGFFAYLPSKKLAIIVYNTLNPKNSVDVNYSQRIVEELVKKIAPDDPMSEMKK